MKLKAFKVSDDEIYAGTDFEDAVKAAMNDTLNPRTSYFEVSDGPLPDDYEVQELDEDEKPVGPITVAECIKEMTEPGLIACDY